MACDMSCTTYRLRVPRAARRVSRVVQSASSIERVELDGTRQRVVPEPITMLGWSSRSKSWCQGSGGFVEGISLCSRRDLESRLSSSPLVEDLESTSSTSGIWRQSQCGHVCVSSAWLFLGASSPDRADSTNQASNRTNQLDRIARMI